MNKRILIPLIFLLLLSIGVAAVNYNKLSPQTISPPPEETTPIVSPVAAPPSPSPEPQQPPPPPKQETSSQSDLKPKAEKEFLPISLEKKIETPSVSPILSDYDYSIKKERSKDLQLSPGVTVHNKTMEIKLDQEGDTSVNINTSKQIIIKNKF